MSHYLLVRALEGVKLSEKDLTVVNTSDADIVSAYETADVTAVVTWNPMLADIKARAETKKVFDSSSIPGEIIDIMMVNTATLKDNPNFGKALVGAWYEMMGIMSRRARLGNAARGDGESLRHRSRRFRRPAQDDQMFYKPAEAVAFTKDPKLARRMNSWPSSCSTTAFSDRAPRARISSASSSRAASRRRQVQGQAALRSDLYGNGRRGQTLSRSSRASLSAGDIRGPSPPSGPAQTRSALTPAGQRGDRGTRSGAWANIAMYRDRQPAESLLTRR